MIVSLMIIVIMRIKSLRLMLNIRLVTITFVQILMCWVLLIIISSFTIIIVLPFHQGRNRRRLGSS
jgi:hypothetical protein